jgi:hypothetical protein
LLQWFLTWFLCFFFMIFSKIIFVDFIFLILSWLRITTIVFSQNIVDCYSVSLHGSFFFFFSFFLYDFFQNCLCCFYFFNITLVENLTLYFFLKNTVDCYSHSPYIFFFVMNVFKIVFINFIFLILSWLRITTVYFLTKYYRLLQCFLTWFFFLSFFLCFFSKIIFLVFSWKHYKLQQSFSV